MRTRLLMAGLLILAIAGCTSGSTPAAEPSATANPEPSTAPAMTPTPGPAVLDVKVTFDGGTCTYLGPTVILDGTLVRFEYLPETNFGDTYLLIYGVKPGTTWQIMVEESERGGASDPPSWVYEDTASWIQGAGTMLYTIESVKMGLTNPHTDHAVGGFGLGCATPDWYVDDPSGLYHAALLTIAGP